MTYQCVGGPWDGDLYALPEGESSFQLHLLDEQLPIEAQRDPSILTRPPKTLQGTYRVGPVLTPAEQKQHWTPEELTDKPHALLWQGWK